ncbi:hypothetical protein HY024_00435 [Candidatus Curtissbacteria bacterium]|nr:hypothetical protein [Candidatus Curtissbacteria bacterium]
MRHDDGRRMTGVDERREYWINSRGYEIMGLSSRALEIPAIRDFVGIEIDVQHLWGSIYTEAEEHEDGRLLQMSDYKTLISKGLIQPPSKEFGPSIGIRLAQAEKLAKVAEFILGAGGVGYVDRMDESIAVYLQYAISPLGMNVTHDPEIVRTPKGITRPGAWEDEDPEAKGTRKFVPSTGNTYGHHTESKEFIEPHLRTITPTDLDNFWGTVSALGIPKEQAMNDRVQGFVHVVIEAQDFMLSLQRQIGKSSEPGLIPSDQERIIAVAKIMKVMISILQSGFGGNQIDQADIALTLNEALTQNYGVTVVPEPQTDNLLS